MDKEEDMETAAEEITENSRDSADKATVKTTEEVKEEILEGKQENGYKILHHMKNFPHDTCIHLQKYSKFI